MAGAAPALDVPLHPCFRVVAEQRIRRGSFHSLVALQAVIKRYLAEHKANPKPFVCTATPTAILAKPDACSV
ncbi:hypothetical protein SAMN04487779_10522 [Belnapia rosea]|uniref:Transposase n=1 Tax=Belnapia rosea TaxID=938405 RepID=A0A1G7DSH1_9PROT|nr:hypothetical protein SAMN04487779_10522 [Belnapia rosea]